MPNIEETAKKIIDLSELSMDDSIYFLQQIRFFSDDVKIHGKNEKLECKSNIIKGWLLAVDRFNLNQDMAEKEMSAFYDEVYEKYKPNGEKQWNTKRLLSSGTRLILTSVTDRWVVK